MNLSAHYIALFADALAGDEALTAWCITNFNRPHLIRKQENPSAPLGSTDAPWVALLSWTGGEFGEVSAAHSCAVNVTCGISDPARDDVESPARAATVSQERTATQPGIEEVGDAALAETFLEMVIGVLKAAGVDGLIETAGAESDGWSQYPLQLASAVITIRQPANTFG